VTDSATTLWWRDGVPIPRVLVDATQPLLQRGDGLFETIRAEHGVPWDLDAHLGRLGDGLAFGHFPELNIAAIRRHLLVAAAEAATRWSDCATKLRLVVAPDAQGDRCTSWLSADPISAAVEDLSHAPARLVVSDISHPGLGQLGKSISYAWSATAMRRARGVGFDDALMVRDGFVVETACASLLWSDATGRLYTADAELGGLASTTLRALARAGYPMTEVRWSAERLAKRATRVCLVSALRLVCPVGEISYGGGVASVGEASVGFAGSLREALRSLLSREAARLEGASTGRVS